MHTFLIIVTALIFIAFLCFGIASLIEKEQRAAVLSFAIAFALPIVLIAFIRLSIYIPSPIHLSFIVIFILIAILLLVPIKAKLKTANEQPLQQFDERNTMFSRLELTRMPKKQHEYYEANPDKLELDKAWHHKPGLMSDQSALYNPLSFKAADASFFPIEQLRPFVNGETNENITHIAPDKAASFIKNWALKLGAVSVGFCQMKTHHYYSVGGRAERYGKTIEPKHKFGIALTIEMDKEFLSMGPEGPTLMESARQYSNSGNMAIQIARFIRNLGYEARAHIDGNYEVVCPTVARDAGLGEIGRMGLLMTPELGPRVRIAVITTNLPLTISQRKPNHSIQYFCSICKKCANVCPGQAIQKTDIQEIAGVFKWQLNHEKCFSYWCISGTDCGRCMSVCPYSHPNNIFHNAVRWGIKNNVLFSNIALKLDNIFYGRKPKPKKIPDWLKI